MYMHIASHFSVNSIVIPVLWSEWPNIVIHRIRTYVYPYCIRFQHEFNRDTHLMIGVTYYGYCWNQDIFISLLHQISMCIQLLYLFCDQSNLIWKEFENVVSYMSEDVKLYGDVDFKQSYFTCGVQLTLYSFCHFCHTANE